MNLREVNRMIASLIAEDEAGNKELIEFYRRKREELIVKIKEDVAKKLEEIQCSTQK